MSSTSTAGGGASGKSKPEYVSSGYDRSYHYNEDTYYDNEEPSCKKYSTTNNQPIKLNGEDVKAEDSDTDDSDEELGNMIYESSRTAKKFREQEAAERITESESHEGNTKSGSGSNECTNTDVQGAAPKQGMRQCHQNIQLDLNRMHHQHHFQHHSTPATESVLQNNWQQMLKSRMNGECTNDNNERTNTVVQGGEPRQGRRQIKEKYPDGTLHIPGMSGAGENRTMHHHQHHPQPVGPSPQPQYQYPGGYHLQTYVQPFQHQHQQYLYVTTYAVPPGYTVLQPPVPDSLKPKNTSTSGGSSSSSTNGDGTSAASSSNTKLKRKKKFSPSSATEKRHSHSSLGGVCMGHGAAKKICSHEGCTNHVKRSGVCWRHGAKRTLPSCRHEGCTNHAKKGGVCIRHGAKVKNKTCNHEGCT